MKKALIVVFVIIIALCAFGGVAVRKFMAGMSKPGDGGKYATVEKGDITVQVVESGTVDAVKSVEVKSRVSGRLAKLMVDEGDIVTQGQMIAIIDPKETELRVDQDRAQLRGAQSAVARTGIEIEQRRVTARAAYDQAKARLDQVLKESKAQPTLTEASVTQAQSGLLAAQKELDRLRSSVHPNEITASQTAKREAEANYRNAQANYERQVELEKKGYVAGRAVEDAQLALDLARARLDSTTATAARVESQQSLEIQKLEQDIRRLEAEVRRAQASRISDDVKRDEVASARAALRQAAAALRDTEAMGRSRDQGMATVQQLSSMLSNSERELGETEIRAPISGIVTQKLVQEGELVASLSGFSAGTPIVRIEVRDAMRVNLNINEIDVAKLQVGMGADVSVDALPERKLKGRVFKIAPASVGTGQQAAAAAAGGADPVVKYEVEVRLSDQEPRMRSGMSAKCTMETISKKGVLRVPVEFVGKGTDERFVMVAPKSNDPAAKPTKQVVQVGISSGAFVEITSGVKEGMKLVKPEFSGPDRKGAMQFGRPQDEEEEKEAAKEKAK